MKTYKNTNIASQIAAKASKKSGEAHEVFPYMGGFAVVTAAQKLALEAQIAEAAALATQMAAEASETLTPEGGAVATEADTKPSVSGAQLIAMDVLGAYSSKGYVYTPVLDGVKRKAKTRWFPADKVETVAIPGGLRLIAPAKVFTSRDINIDAAVPPDSELPATLVPTVEPMLAEPEQDVAAENEAMLAAEGAAA